MAIQIIDNFSLNANKPIDNRFVVGGGNFYSDKDNITHKYEGLRIWDLTDDTPYVWDGTQWISENTLGISGSGITNFISKFTGTASIGNSQIFDNGTNVGIGTTTPTNKLSVIGDISSSGNFIGNGSQLTSLNIDSSNVTGKIGLGNLPNGTNGHILQSTGSSTQWVAQSVLSVGNATNSTTSNTTQNVNITESSTNGTRYLLFVDSVGDRPINTNITNSIRINPSNGNIGFSGNPQSYKLYVNGGASIGNISIPPINGLRVQGETNLFNKLKIIKNLDSFEISHSTSSINLEIDNITQSGTRMSLYSPINGKRTRLDKQIGLTQFSTDDDILYISTANVGVIRFGDENVGGSGGQFRMHMIGSTQVEGSHGLHLAGSGTNLLVDGEAYKTGASWASPSDIRLKKDIVDFKDGLEKILNLNPVYYKFKENDEKEHIGFIAQDVELVTPYMVRINNSNGLEDCRVLDESALTKILVNAIKEQQSIIEDLTKRIEDLES